MKRTFKSFKHYSITTLPLDIRKYITAEMSYTGGGMQCMLKRNAKHTRVCLVYYRRKIIGWTALELDKTTVGRRNYSRPSITAWISMSFRHQGCASVSIRELLRRYRRQLKYKVHITVYHPKIKAVVNDCGYKGCLVEWP